MNIYDIITEPDDARLLREYADDYVRAIGKEVEAKVATESLSGQSITAARLLWAHSHWLRQKYASEYRRLGVDEQHIYAAAFHEAWEKAKGAKP
jgi:hypothetical protein